jgi:tRNA dimethylallyltransferase
MGKGNRGQAIYRSMNAIFLAGPTAVGKSEVALLLAEKLAGEIISVDSMQVYRGLDIGTAKPSAAERARVPHHLIDVADLDEPFDAARFCALAREIVAQISGRGHRPIFCGGTGLYFKAYLEGLGAAPPADPQLRAQLESSPLNVLLDELAAKDPATFEQIDRQNPRRVIRAVEVIRLTGKPFSVQRSAWTRNADATTQPLIVLSRPKPELDARIHARVDAMFGAGLVEETRALLAHGLERNPTAMQAIGYRQVVEHLRGDRDLPSTIELIKVRTRQFAKRQATWFRRHAAAKWIEINATDDIPALAGRVLAGI